MIQSAIMTQLMKPALLIGVPLSSPDYTVILNQLPDKVPGRQRMMSQLPVCLSQT